MSIVDFGGGYLMLLDFLTSYGRDHCVLNLFNKKILNKSGEFWKINPELKRREHQRGSWTQVLLFKQKGYTND